MPRPDNSRDRLWTEAEFLALPRSAEKIELIDGELIRESEGHWPDGDACETNRLWSYDEFMALPESSLRIELLDGELIRQPPLDFAHQQRLASVASALSEWRSARSPKPDVCVGSLDVRMGPWRVVQPDAFVYVQPLPRPVPTPITVVPDLCVEIVMNDRVYDRITKRLVYAEAGVREYWTVVPRLGFVERWTGERLRTREECTERLVTPLLPGFELDVTGLLKEP
jgi:Uma2 family endonuclease